MVKITFFCRYTGTSLRGFSVSWSRISVQWDDNTWDQRVLSLVLLEYACTREQNSFVSAWALEQLRRYDIPISPFAVSSLNRTSGHDSRDSFGRSFAAPTRDRLCNIDAPP